MITEPYIKNSFILIRMKYVVCTYLYVYQLSFCTIEFSGSIMMKAIIVFGYTI